jgi:hypothetical protein
MSQTSHTFLSAYLSHLQSSFSQKAAKIDKRYTSVRIRTLYIGCLGARGGAVVEALRYKSEGRGIDSRWCHRNFSLM